MLGRFTLIAISICFAAYAFSANETSDPKGSAKPAAISDAELFGTFQGAVKKIELEYVEDPDKQKMLDSAISGLLSDLDPHSAYLVDEDLKDLMINTKGDFGGIGVEIINDHKLIKVIAPIDDLPADKAGIKAGDYIVKVNDDKVSEIGFNKALSCMKGDPGTKVKLTIIREGESKPIEFELTRATVKIKVVRSHTENDIGYIRISSFTEHTKAELVKALTKLQKESQNGIKGILLDLRNNPGGLLEQAVAVCDLFIKDGIILTTKGRNSAKTATYEAKPNSEKAPDVPLVVLINGGSASASEIVAGAIQDRKRGIIMGSKSFGKGSVQTIFKINERAVIKLTTDRYYTPSGRSIQAEGIVPDILVTQANVEYLDPSSEDKISEKSLRNYLKKEKYDQKNSETLPEKQKLQVDKVENSNKDSSNISALSTSEIYKKDYQYARAVDLLTAIAKVKNMDAD